ncbi:MAG: hypothetical protein IH855_09655 [Bacteroidetes bacterium]|nr:hypothetical protein [Bacteroidota bacterium]
MVESRVTRDFWKRFSSLPTHVQERARTSYALWIENPRHPRLHFKRISKRQPIWSARVGAHHRALALWEKEGESVWWFWIGRHAEYDALIKRL